MKKHFSRSLALLLALLMVLTMFPAMSFATNVGEAAALVNGLPEDGSYGVIYYCGASSGGYVIGADVDSNDGTAPAKAVTLSQDGTRIQSLPNGAGVFRFVKNSDGTYYLLLGQKYLAVILVNGRSKLVLQDGASGAKWDITEESEGSGVYNVASHDVKSSYKYIEFYSNAFSAYKMTEDPTIFQFKFFSCSADTDGRIGEAMQAGDLPTDGSKVVIYCAEAKAVFGQPTNNSTAPALAPAAATLRSGTLAYQDIADGGMIFNVSVTGSGSSAVYTFENNGKYLAMPENTVENGKTNNEEYLYLIEKPTDDKLGYIQWTLTKITGGYCMYNKAAMYGTNACCIEYFNDVFSGWTYKGGTPELFAMNFYSMEDPYNAGYVVNPFVEIEAKPAIGLDCPVQFTIHDVSEQTEVKAEYFTDASATPKTAQPEISAKVGTFTIPAADLEGAAKLTIRVSAANTLGVSYNKELVCDVEDEPQIITSGPAANSATGEEKRPEIFVTYANAQDGAKFEMTLDGKTVSAAAKDGRLSYKPAADLEDGKHSVSVTITRKDKKTATRNWSFYVGEGGEALYFGQIHAHTSEYSDGAGTLEEAYEHAHGVSDLDFIIITDHSNYFDETSSATTSSYYDLSPLKKTASGTTTKWEEARATAKEYNDKWDDFLCVYGYEMTWSGGPGHTNTFNTYGVVSRNNAALNNKDTWAGMHLYNDLMVNADKGLDVNGAEAKTTRDGKEAAGVNATKYIPFDAEGKAVPVVSQFNHPGITFGNFGAYAGLTARRDDVLNLIEVGNGEGKVGGSAYFPSYSEYDLCLSKGWHVGPTNNQDNHKGNWGDSNTCRDVILTDDFSEIGLYRALDARRIYATEDQNLEIYYELSANDQTYKLGDIADIDEDNQPEKITIHLTVNEPDKENISTIQVIGDAERVLHTIELNGRSYKGDIELANDSGFYYIKVVEADKQIAVTAPIWVKEATPISAELETSASVPVQGEEETVKVTLTNSSQSESITVKAFTLTAEGKALDTKFTELSLEPDSDQVWEIPFTPAKTDPAAKKTYEIEAIFKVEVKGKEVVIKKSISETSLPPEMMTYIGLDKGHKNFYVSGDYASNEGSFIRICADHGIICKYIEEGEMTKENLAKFKLVVISVPRVSETVAPPVFTAEELAALKDYADKGGSIINLCKSDRYDYTELGEDGKDTYKYASATLSNMINEALGAKTRFVRGIVVDPEKKANEAYRIYFAGKELLGDHPFNEGIFAASNGEYQWYNGTGITIQKGAEKDVTTLVAPYDSSWIACYKDNFTGSSYEPNYDKDTVMAKKGEFSLVTYEKLSGGGFLVNAGAAFISNYDLKSTEPAAQQYENYSMVCNILDTLTGANNEKVTPIAQVHKGQVGQEFTIEGWITSNASDYDKDTAFFDCVYIQDETRGINAFPVSGYYYIGEKVRAHGGVTYYCGEIELNLGSQYDGSIKVISNDLNILEPKAMSCKQAMSDDNIGNLTKITGVITDIHKTAGVIDYIYVDDGSGEIGTLFINAYIQKESKALDNAAVGMMVEGVGIGSRDVNENSTDGSYIKRLRVRARDEIRVWNDPCLKFTDVNRSRWYHSAVDYVLNNGIMKGLTDTLFGPNDPLTREMFVTMLWRMDGKPKASIANPFKDVPTSRYSYKAILWAAENGITKGRTADTFDRTASLTRQELATFFRRYCEYAGYDVSATASLDQFPDKDNTSKFAVRSMKWAVALGLLKGVKTDHGVELQPKEPTTRAQAAAILERFAKLDVANSNDIIILYTNDVHCGIDNTADSFGYAGLAAYKAEEAKFHKNVALVDAGDFIQGAAIGSLSKGAKIVDLMNYVGYDVATLGNHEFDYGVDNILSLTKQAKFDIITSNWVYTGPAGAADAVDLEGYKLVNYNGVKVAYVGITTPESLAKSTPTYFQDENGAWIYDFCNDKEGTKLYEAVQSEVDAARKAGAKYVVALAHLGIDEGSAPWRSTDVIANTNGIDVVLDGHSHSTIISDVCLNKDGEEVLLSSTGTKLANIGKLTITKDGLLKTELITRKGNDKKDAKTEAYVEKIKAEYNELLQQVVVKDLAVNLTINNPNRLDATGKPVRAVRYQETNLGDVCADAYVYAAQANDVDIAFVNGGGVRADIKAGDVTYENIIAVHPFGNELVVVAATGQQIIDALEMASRNTTMTEDGLVDGECGGFLQVSGLKYTIYTGTPSSVVTDSATMFESVSGARRVGNVQVLNKTTGEYEPIDLNKTYNLASHNYMLLEGGDGLNMFMKDEVLRSGGKLDNEVLIEYFNSDLFKERLASGIYNNWNGDNARITVSPDAAPADQPEDPGETKEYTLTSALKDGDKVVIYNAGNGKALYPEMNGYYVKGQDAAVTDNKIAVSDEALVWTVAVKEDGSYSFTNGDSVLAAGQSENNGRTYNNLYLDAAEHSVNWILESCNAETSSFYVYNATLPSSYGHVFLEWYASKDGFSAYDTGASRLTEKDFGIQFFAETASEPVNPDPGPEPGGNEFVLSSELKAGDKVVIVNAAKNIALSSEPSAEGSFYNGGVAVSPADGKLTVEDEALVFEVGKEGELYTFSNNGRKFSMDTGYSSTPFDKVNDTWSIEPGNTEGTFFIKNNGRNLWLEWYEQKNYWSCYKDNSNAELFELHFYVQSEGGSEPVDPEPEPEPSENEYLLSSELKAGDKVVIVNAAKNIALSSEPSAEGSFYNGGVAVSPADGKLTVEDETLVFEVGKEGELYTFSNNGRKFSMDTGYSSTPFDKVNDTWSIEPGNTEGTFFIKNNGRNLWLEWYEQKNYWSCYKDNSNAELFELQFYVLSEGGDEPVNPDPEPTEEAYVLTSELKAGDEVMIFYPTANKVMTGEDYFYNNKKHELVAADATVADGKLTAPENALVLTVEIDEAGKYSFKTADGKYLSMDGTNVQLDAEAGANTLFQLEAAEAAESFYIKADTATFQSKAQYMEFYSGYFTVYSFNASKKDIYTFQFFAKTEVEAGEEPVNPDPDPDPDPEPTEARFVKVTGAQSDWSGTYIIVGETADGQALVFDGQADAENNNTAAAIQEGAITIGLEYAVTVEKSGEGYSLLMAGGYLDSKDGNSLLFSSSPAVCSVSWDAEKACAVITSAKGMILRYNCTYSSSRFRFYKPTSGVITGESEPLTRVYLYKLAEG